ncbi:MAG: KamA family radical SAM protein [Candidatus Magasanikiibacteriota bacterium]
MQQWQKDLANSITSVSKLAKKLKLEGKELQDMLLAEKKFGLLITPIYLRLLKKEKTRGSIHKQLIPTIQELNITSEELADPIGDDDFSPLKGLTHRYPDRALIWPTSNCAIHCRFCFRKRIVGNAWALSDNEIKQIIKYLKIHQEIQEIIFSGGDPFMLNDQQLMAWLKEINKIKHIKRIRFHTRLFSALPNRFSLKFFKKIQLGKPIFIVLHINHPTEITPEFLKAVKQARQAGILLFSQSVLLKGVNDDVKTLKELFNTLLNIGVTPYYLHQTDKVYGTSHLRVELKDGIKLMRQLQGNISGLAIPKYMIEIPKGLGKVPIDLGLFNIS